MNGFAAALDLFILGFLIWMFFRTKKVVNSLDARVAEQVKIRLDYEIGKRRSEEREWLQVEIKKQIIQFVQEQKLKALQKKTKEE